jgi:hypothetical protein
MSDITLKSLDERINFVCKETGKRFEDLSHVYATKESVNDLEVEVGNKVSTVWFLGIILTILSLQATFFYFMWAKIESISEDASVTRESVANIQGKLEPFDFIIEQ